MNKEDGMVDKLSNTQVDKIGKYLTGDATKISEEILLSAEEGLDKWRQSHLEPLTEVSLKLQEWFESFPSKVYIAQRLKRKPQIIKKLKRKTTRLSQLQDIGGCRAIFETPEDVTKAIEVIKARVHKSRFFEIIHEDDYRDIGREESGYRALHLIVLRNSKKIEIQLRTMRQHAWAEGIERTSIICKCDLKSNIVLILVDSATHSGNIRPPHGRRYFPPPYIHEAAG